MSQPPTSPRDCDWRSRARPEATHEEIARHARNLWEQHGRPAGRDEQIWLEAERQLRGLELTPSRVAERLAHAGLNTHGRTVYANGRRPANGGHAMSVPVTVSGGLGHPTNGVAAA